MKVTIQANDEASTKNEFPYHVIYKNGDDLR